MELRFSNKFKQDRDFYRGDNVLFNQIAGKMKEIQNAGSIKEVRGLEIIRGRKIYYRFKIISGKIIYRIGIRILNGKVWFLLIDTYKKRFYERF